MTSTMELKKAPDWQTTTWLNATAPLSLEALRGRVVFLHTFQMLCPGCVSRGIPQAQRVYELFKNEPVSVVGLHTVFEHHDAMQEVSLRAFLHEYRVQFPVGIDKPGQNGNPTPQTMHAYGLRGTPSMVLIDQQGYIRRTTFGAHDDLLLGADIASLLAEVPNFNRKSVDRGTADHTEGCDDDQCELGVRDG